MSFAVFTASTVVGNLPQLWKNDIKQCYIISLLKTYLNLSLIFTQDKSNSLIPSNNYRWNLNSNKKNHWFYGSASKLLGD